MRLVDIDRLITEIRDNGDSEQEWGAYEIVALLEHEYKHQSENGVNQVLPVCLNCEHCKYIEDRALYYCRKHKMYTEFDNFCKYAESEIKQPEQYDHIEIENDKKWDTIEFDFDCICKAYKLMRGY